MFSNDLKSTVRKIKDSHNYGWDELKKQYSVLKSTIEIVTNCSLSESEWDCLISELEHEDFVNKSNTISLSSNYDNDLKLSDYRYSAWPLYRDSLKAKGWSDKSIQNLTNSVSDILKQLQTDNSEPFACKGLVVGDIQSGKTANMTGLIANAADSGFNYFIILSGMIESLRKQTSQRIRSDLTTDGSTNLHWKIIDNPSLRQREFQLENFDFRKNSHNRYITVCLKNSKRLKALKNWLTSNRAQQEQMKVLIIDDEADQASIDTKNIDKDERTAINQSILDIVNDRRFGAMNYVAYTATPFANVLNEAGEKSLYPKDFIELLEPAENYIGTSQIFGTSDPELSPGLRIVKQVSDHDALVLKSPLNQKSISIPNSLKDAINWFLLSVSAMRSYNYRKPISMMIHTSFKIADHKEMAKLVSEYLLDLKRSYPSYKDKLRSFYESIQDDLSLDRFLAVMTEYTNKDQIHDYPSWDTVKNELEYLLNLSDHEFITNIQTDEKGALTYGNGIHLCVDNSDTKGSSDDSVTRLIYPDEVASDKKAPAFIVIGGNTLSRGLTIQGLVSTYFLRTTSQADTLMQMARWYGFRIGYELFPRVWMDGKAIKRYSFLSQMNFEMRETLATYAIRGLTPKEFAPVIKECPEYQLVRVTSNNKMQGAVPTSFNFLGVSPQTTAFENDLEFLQGNIDATEKFLMNLPKNSVQSNGNIVWKNIQSEKIMEYLNEYRTLDRDRTITNIPNVVKWLDSNLGDQGETMPWDKWNVVLAGPSRTYVEPWSFGGYQVNKVCRSKKPDTGNILDIGVLRGPSDLLADITDGILTKEEKTSAARPEKMRQTRENHGLGLTPQLLIYCIDKDSKPQQNTNRLVLNAKADVIGLSILIPGVAENSKQNHINKIQIDLKRFIKEDSDLSDDAVEEN